MFYKRTHYYFDGKAKREIIEELAQLEKDNGILMMFFRKHLPDYIDKTGEAMKFTLIKDLDL